MVVLVLLLDILEFLPDLLNGLLANLLLQVQFIEYAFVEILSAFSKSFVAKFKS